MGTAKVETLLIDMQVENARLQQGLRKARGDIEAFGLNVSAAMRKVTAGFAAVGQSLASLDRVGKSIKRASNDVAQLSAVVVGAGAAALHLASQVDGRTKAAMDGLTLSTQQLAVPLAQMLLPAVQELTKDIQGLARWVGGLDPAVKAQVATWARWAVEVGGAAFILGKLGGLLSVVSGAFGGLFSVLGAIGAGALLELTAGLLLVAGAVAGLHYAWRKNLGGIQDITRGVLDTLRGWFGKLGEFVGLIFESILKSWFNLAKGLISQVINFQKLIGADTTFADGILGAVEGLEKDLLSGDFLKNALDFGKKWGGELVEGVKEEFKVIGKELGLDKLLAQVRGLSSGQGELVSGGVPVSAIGASGADITARVAAQPSFAGAGLGPGGALKTSFGVADPLYNVKRALEDFGSALKRGGELVASRLGDFGGFLQNVINGAQQGGLVGAIVAAVADLASRTESFQRLVTQLGGFLNDLVQAIEPVTKWVFDAVGRVVAAVTGILTPLLGALAPVFELLGGIIDSVVPFVQLVATALQGFAPVIASLGRMLSVVLTILKPVFQLLFPIVQGLLGFVLGVMGAIVTIWDGIVETLAGIVDTIIGVITLGAEQHGGNFIRNWKLDPKGELAAAQKSLSTATWDSTNATVDRTKADQAAAGAANNLGTVMDGISESLTNVPSGYKVALARFNATAPGGRGSGGGGASGSGGVTVYGDVNVYGANDLDEMAEQLEQRRRRARNEESGNPNDADWDPI